ncbi:AIPR family protein [Tolypothrix bouteillei VB521301_2]|uniref:AIPR family protein n=1 Tax=Tolypothrix bouteillei TaxID=1246981 RepID=UPI0038B516F4
MPKTFVIKGESISNLLSQGSHLYIVVTARVEDFPTDIPLTPNIREPNKKSSTYKEIFNSLVGEPKAFFNRNNGIKISAKKSNPKCFRKRATYRNITRLGRLHSLWRVRWRAYCNGN